MGLKGRRPDEPSIYSDDDPFTYWTDGPAASSAFRSVDWSHPQETQFSRHHVLDPAAASTYGFQSGHGPFSGYTGSRAHTGTGPFHGFGTGSWTTRSHTGHHTIGIDGPSLTGSVTITNVAAAVSTDGASSSAVIYVSDNSGSTSSRHITTGQLAAAIVFPLLIILLSVFIFLFVGRLRKKRKQAAAARETRGFLPPNTRTGGPEMLPAYHYHHSTPAIFPQRHASMSSGYYTGIDTAALTANAVPLPHSLGNHEEPPPPYRPRSAAGNAPQHTESNRSIAQRDNSDTVSEVSDLHPEECHPRGADDSASMVSDVSLDEGRAPSAHHVV